METPMPEKDPTRTTLPADDADASNDHGEYGQNSRHPQQQEAHREQDPGFEGSDRQEQPPAPQDLDPGTPESPTKEETESADPAFPIICIGASAGGLEAIEAFVGALPAASGLAFVVVTHTDPGHVSMMPELIKRKARAAVKLIEPGMPIEADTIYIPPSNRDPVIRQGMFELNKRPDKPGAHMPIDLFCKHLAQARQERCGCVILSGTGTDGTYGIRLIKENAGLVLAQDERSAKHAGMPTSAVESGFVDDVLHPAQMPQRLIAYFKHPARIKIRAQDEGQASDPLGRILAFMANRTRHDFALYKTSTLVRRIERRMTVTRSENPSAYLDFLHHNPSEIRALFQDLLIGVTSFFRDPEAYAFLKQNVFPELLARSGNGGVVRAWMPGCSTGEEAFSVAITLNECLDAENINRDLQIFATDIDGRAIAKARQGVYLPNIANDVGEQRLERFFRKMGGLYQVKREIREAVIFAEHNVLRDPPFSNLDLLVCRNLLIYLKSEAQNKLLPLFHYTLKKNGILFLGTAESVGLYPELFKPLSKPYSIFQKAEHVSRPKVEFPTGVKALKEAARANAPQGAEASGVPAHHQVLAHAVEQELLKAHTPTCIVVNPAGDIVHIHGRTGKYLEPGPGKFNPRLSDMAREGLRIVLLSALRRAREQKEQPIYERGLRIKTNGGYQYVDLIIKSGDLPPLKDLLLIIFQERSEPPAIDDTPHTSEPDGPDAAQRIEELEHELMRVNQSYRQALEELETSNEELQSSNEEMQSSNEELQSTNEELESSREELQSLNEELSTVNSELHSKINELKQAFDAITHVLNSTHIAIVFLDKELRVQRFTREATRLINLIETDVGRPIEHISHNLDYGQLTQKARRVLETLTSFEDEVATKDRIWYRMSILVHRNERHGIEGVVLTFVDIDSQKKAQQKLESMGGRIE
jgi:two-component system, chemotaxis family, CheB/CheR fusion protein